MTDPERAAQLIAGREARFSAGLARLNALPAAEAAEAFAHCCGASSWVAAMVAQRPFATSWALLIAARAALSALERKDLLEAFAGHPRSGDLEESYAEYHAQFGYPFVAADSGAGASDRLALLWDRLENPPALELKIAAAEQEKIIRRRLEELLERLP